jgi:hypothetical protein
MAEKDNEEKQPEIPASTEASEQVAGERQSADPGPGLIYGMVGAGSFSLSAEPGAVAKVRPG